MSYSSPTRYHTALRLDIVQRPDEIPYSSPKLNTAHSVLYHRQAKCNANISQLRAKGIPLCLLPQAPKTKTKQQYEAQEHNTFPPYVHSCISYSLCTKPSPRSVIILDRAHVDYGPRLPHLQHLGKPVARPTITATVS